MTSEWEKNNMDENMRTVLSVDSHEPEHHFGRPFLTPYQIAIRFTQRFPQEAKVLGKPVGGEGAGPGALSQYIAHELSTRIEDHRITFIEGRFLCMEFLNQLTYNDGTREIKASGGQTHDLSLFRLPEPDDSPTR